MSSACRKVLVVEDDPVINQAVSDRLGAEGYDVVWEDPSLPEGISTGLSSRAAS